MKAPRVVYIEVAADEAHYHAATALDELLGWFVADGYSAEQLEELASERIASVTEDD